MDEFFALLDNLALPTEATVVPAAKGAGPTRAEADQSLATAPTPAAAPHVVAGGSLRGRPFAILATDGLEESEGEEPRRALHRVGALTDVVRRRRLTSYPSVRVDLINAGAEWVDEAIVVDPGLVTSRSPDDLNAFNKKLLHEFAEGSRPKV